MPKIIENIKERAVSEARGILVGEGYGAMTMRRVATALEVAPATLYHYFPSKEHLAACVMLEDWRELTRTFEAGEEGLSPEETVRALFGLVRSFAETYARSWTEYGSSDGSLPVRRRYHAVLVEQLGGYVGRALPPERREEEPWLAPFLAELILRFGSDSASDYREIEPGVNRLLR